VTRGLFLVFEGTEGSGKSTQVRLVAERFRDSGLPVTTTREPGGTPLGEAVRGILLADEFGEIDARTEALLHTAARAEHVSAQIRPALEAGTHVLCDRFYDSTLAYQGGGSGLQIDDLRNLQKFAIGATEPDQRILLVTNVEVGLRRRFSEGGAINRIDRAEFDFHERVASTFRALAAQEPDQWIIVNGEQDAEKVCMGVVTAISERFPELGL
jgi:dTMP kinase